MSTNKPKPEHKPVSRLGTGLIAIGCVIAGCYIWADQPDDKRSMLWAAGFMRAGALLAAIWLALPTKNRPAAWAQMSKAKLAGFVVAIVAMVAQPKVFVPLFAILVVVSFFLRPGRSRHRPDRDSWKK